MFAKEGEMPYRQAWETGQQRAHEMLRQAEHARMISRRRLSLAPGTL